MNIASQINEVLRRVEFDDEQNAIILTQNFPTTPGDLWDACTNPERLARWFEPVTGELHRGGRYRLSDSGTVGTIETCNAPRSLTITWEHGDDVSRVTASIEEHAAGVSVLTVRHSGVSNEYWRQYGPAGGGGGWDAGFFGLAMHLDDPRVDLDAVYRAMGSEEGAEFARRASEEWSSAHQKAGAPKRVAEAAARAALVLDRAQWESADSDERISRPLP